MSMPTDPPRAPAPTAESAICAAIDDATRQLSRTEYKRVLEEIQCDVEARLNALKDDMRAAGEDDGE